MKTLLKLLIFITIPIWWPPYFIGLTIGFLWKDVSDYVEKL